MNDVLQLKGRFEQSSSKSKPGPRNIPKGKVISREHLEALKRQIHSVIEYWKHDTLLINKLICIYYKGIIAKSNRVQYLLRSPGKSPNDSIVGAKFSEEENGKRKHIMTYCVSIDTLNITVTVIDQCISILNSQFTEKITYDQIEGINKGVIPYNHSKLARTSFISVLVDSYYIEKFGIETENPDIDENALITIYDTGIDTLSLFKKMNIDLSEIRKIDETTLLLRPDQYALLKSKAPYLIAMAVCNITKITIDDIGLPIERSISIPAPGNEPVIGVIDTPFDDSVYFSKWVHYSSMISPEIPLTIQDYSHGTKVSSIIVDGPALNPSLDDGCGRFRVRHFGVAAGGRMNSFTVVRAIKEIIAANRDIKVWNMSLGSVLEVNKNFISPEAAILDQIQYENDVIFVISGTNKLVSEVFSKRIGSPADSINSLVVNSVTPQGKPASYSREGPVLSFFNKPDVSYYGGDQGCELTSLGSSGLCLVTGTSFAVPWIARKLAYLIHVMGLSREAAKALIIDSAAGWVPKSDPSHIIGFGVVPKRIEEIICSPNDEIRFILSGVSEKYDTYTYNIPVPVDKEKHPFVARATLCYFPKCSRNQGVDYTNTELDIHFGRLTKNTIKAINNNVQCDEGLVYLCEEDARSYYRKWDNIKHIGEYYSYKTKARKAYENGLWGLSIKTKERLNKEDGKGISFGVVITLKEVNGKNRIEEFIQHCSLRGWLINRINVENKIDIYNKAEEVIKFD